LTKVTAEGLSFNLGRWITSGRSRLDRGLGESSQPELKENTVAPWPDLAGTAQSHVLGHESRNRRHRDVEKLTTISPRAKPTSRSSRSALVTEEGGQRPLQRFGAEHRKHGKAKERVWQLRRIETRLDKELTEAKTRWCEDSSLLWISAATAAWLGQWIALGLGTGSAEAVAATYGSPRRAEQANAENPRRRF